ncbi:hypothetical protein BCF58_3264 [Chryseobacterium defluvii]|uniref:Uncharacterized protein n=1 Tax=Chryseobacterium defluvii TaxID=160396 RepID=A0A495SB97_9FLAO|nr:hypothetical protein BCF58_3264 [Chryseobacterium defluvii]
MIQLMSDLYAIIYRLSSINYFTCVPKQHYPFRFIGYNLSLLQHPFISAAKLQKLFELSENEKI